MAQGKSPLQYKGVRAIAPPDLTIAQRAPNSGDKAYPPGQFWLDETNDASYQWSGTIWISMGSGSTGAVDTLTGDSQGAIVPVAGNIDLLGTAADGISTTGTAGTITFAIEQATTSQRGTLATSTNAQSVTGTDATVAVTPASLTARLAAPGAIGGTTPGAGTFTDLTATGTVHLNVTGAGVTTIGTGGTGAVNIGNATGNTAVTGSLTTTTTLTASLGAITATNGDLVLGTAGNKLSIATGSNASIGTSAAMTAGAITISTTAVTASSKIFLSAATAGGTQGVLSVANIVAATSFDIVSSSNLDTSTVNWLIIN